MLQYRQLHSQRPVTRDELLAKVWGYARNLEKFSVAAQQKVIDIGCQRLRDGSVQFSVRDYGPGVPRDQMKKIFRLFCRSENELTRETVDAAIGLALLTREERQQSIIYNRLHHVVL